MNKKDLKDHVLDVHDASDVSIHIEETKRMNKVHIVLEKKSGRLNLLIIYLTLRRMLDALEVQLGISEPDDGKH